MKFKLTDNFLEQYKGKQPQWGPLGYVTYKRTYSRPVTEESRTEEFWETCRRVVEGCFQIQRDHCANLSLPWNAYKAQKSAQIMYDLMWKFKFLPPGRGLWVMGTDYVATRGSACLNNCLEGDVKFITKTGIKTLKECVGTEQTILTEGGKWVKAPIQEFGKQHLMKITLQRNGHTKIIYATPEHRWFVKDRRQIYRNKGWIEIFTKDLRPNVHRLQYCFGQGIKKIRPSKFGIAHGITYGDGTTTYEEASVRIDLIGKKNKQLKKYFNSSHINSKKDCITVTGLPNFFRKLPNIQENKSYLLGWLAGYFAADGCVHKNGKCEISSANKANLEFVQNVCYRLGIGTYEIREDSRISNLTNKLHTLFRLTFIKSTLTKDFFLLKEHKKRFVSSLENNCNHYHWTIISVEETDKYETVYCATVDKYGKFTLEGNILTGNCAFVSTDEIDVDFAGPFTFLMDMSMLGVGVSGDTRGAGKVVLKEPKYTDNTLVVSDSREGWVQLIEAILNSFVGKSLYPKTVDYSEVRPEGSPIKGFGGTASGPGPLKELVENITKTLMPKDDTPQPITSTQIVDVFNYIGKCVVAGNVRRTAELMLGNPQDIDFLNLKLDKKALSDRRWASNNTVSCTKGMDYSEIADRTITNGEPGYFWLENAQKYGRLADPPNWKDRRALGTNPCGEQTLESYEICNLVETFPSRHDTLEEYLVTLKYAYLYSKTVTLLPTHNQRTNAVMMRNRRIGTSQSGIVASFAKHGRREHFKWCDAGYKALKELDKIYSDWLCVPKSIKITSVKPSGTVSLLPGVPPGIHYPHSEYYVRIIRIATNSPLINICKNAGYVVEPDVVDNTRMCVHFPIKEQNFLRGKADVTLWEQLENAAQMQKYWSDNQVSVTISFKPEEADDIKYALELYEGRLKSVSFNPYVNHGYKQAPYTEITKKEYEKMVKGIRDLNLSSSEHEYTEKYCDGDSCTI